MQDVRMEDMKMTDQVTGREIAEHASFLSISVEAKKKRPTTAECCLSINDQS